MVSPMVISKAEPKRERRRSSATGTGAVLAGAGVVGGGVPGLKPGGMEIGEIKHLSSPGKKVRAYARVAPGGIFGARHHSHKEYTTRAANDAAYFAGQKTSKPNHYMRGVEGGKVAPEHVIMRHLKTGRRISYGLTAGGVGLMALGRSRRKPKPQAEITKRDTERRRRASEALVAGGGTATVGGYGAARGLESQGRKWIGRSKADYEAAQRLNPKVGGWKYGRSGHKVPRIDPEMSNDEVKANANRIFRLRSRRHAEKVGELRGSALQGSYFGHVYGGIGRTFRRKVMPAGAAAAVVGGAGLAANRKPKIEKRKSPEESPYRSQRRRATAASMGYGAAGIGAAAALKAPLAAKLTRSVTRAHGGTPSKIVEHASAAKPIRRMSDWAVRHPKSSYGMGAAGVGALAATRVAARYRRGEEQGLSEKIGPMRAERRKSPVTKLYVPTGKTPVMRGATVRGVIKPGKQYVPSPPPKKRKSPLGRANYSDPVQREVMVSTARHHNASGWPRFGKSLVEPEWVIKGGKQRRNTPRRKQNKANAKAASERSQFVNPASEPAKAAEKVNRSWFRPRNVALGLGVAGLAGGGYLYARSRQKKPVAKAYSQGWIVKARQNPNEDPEHKRRRRAVADAEAKLNEARTKHGEGSPEYKAAASQHSAAFNDFQRHRGRPTGPRPTTAPDSDYTEQEWRNARDYEDRQRQQRQQYEQRRQQYDRERHQRWSQENANERARWTQEGMGRHGAKASALNEEAARLLPKGGRKIAGRAAIAGAGLAGAGLYVRGVQRARQEQKQARSATSSEERQARNDSRKRYAGGAVLGGAGAAHHGLGAAYYGAARHQLKSVNVPKPQAHEYGNWGENWAHSARQWHAEDVIDRAKVNRSLGHLSHGIGAAALAGGGAYMLSARSKAKKANEMRSRTTMRDQQRNLSTTGRRVS